jgi:hypothetical protein
VYKEGATWAVRISEKTLALGCSVSRPYHPLALGAQAASLMLVLDGANDVDSPTQAAPGKIAAVLTEQQACMEPRG